jgi:PD-(D/E)XK nuclease superfamily
MEFQKNIKKFSELGIIRVARRKDLSMPLIDKLVAVCDPNLGNRFPEVGKPLWDGPDGVTPNSGVTQGLLSSFLKCRARLAVKLVDGLVPADTFNHRLEYGQMFHTCCEYEARGEDWQSPLLDYAKNLCSRYPLQQWEVLKWWNVCNRQFPLYLQHWLQHPDTMERTPLLQEHEFSAPYKLPSGRTVRLRGKWDGVDLVGKKAEAGVYLFESKTKGEVDEVEIKRQLAFDLQTQFYAVALLEAVRLHRAGHDVGLPEEMVKYGSGEFRGVRYNVVRRPLSGGKGSIVQKKASGGGPCSSCEGRGRTKKLMKRCGKCNGTGRAPSVRGETDEEYYARLAQYIANEPGTYFMRWTVTLTQQDVERFRRQSLDPMLEQLCDWWEWIEHCCQSEEPDKRDLFRPRTFRTSDDRFIPTPHWRTPYGAGDDYWSPDVDAYLDTGKSAGLQRTTVVFPELGGD